MFKPLRAALIASLIATAGSAATAASIFEQVPSSSPSGLWSNQTANQNFLVRVVFNQDVLVNGFEIFTDSFFGVLNTPVTFKVRSDASGIPEATNLVSLTDAIDRAAGTGASFFVGSDFSPVALSAGVYWMGLSGASQIGWRSFGPVVPAGQQYQLSGNTLQFTPGIGTLAFRVLGDVAPAKVPEPSSVLLVMGAALAMMGLVGVRRRKAQGERG